MKYSVKYELAKSTGEVCPIRARVSYAGKRVDIRLGYSVPPTCWVSSTMSAKADIVKNKSLCASVNKAIKDLNDKLEKLFTKCEIIENRIPTTEEVKSVQSGTTPTKLSEVYNMYLKENIHLEPNTYSVHEYTRDSFIACCGDMPINDITDSVLLNFECKLVEQGRYNTSISTLFGQLKAILNFAKKKNIYTANGLEFKSKLKIAPKEVIYLEPEELTTLLNADLKKSKALVRDMFCLCCFTGLRFSDMIKLKWANIHNGYINLVTTKTTDNLHIELNKYSQTILDRQNTKGVLDTVFPPYSISCYEDTIRDVCKKIDLSAPITNTYYIGNQRFEETKPKWEFMTSHVARKTFVVNGLILGIPIEVIMRWTGHKTLESMAPYIKIVDRVRSSQMKKFDSL